MSYKFQAKREIDCWYVLPKTGNMQCQVDAFLSEPLYEATDEATWAQAVDAASYPGIEAVVLMPDTHLGAVVPIGCVMVSNDTLVLAGAGYDISCGVLAMRIPGLSAEQVAPIAERRRWIEEVEKRVATGVGSHRTPLQRSFSISEVEEILRTGAQSLGVRSDTCERLFLPVDEQNFCAQRVDKAVGKLIPQLGSLGGGNHFIELQCDPADGSVWAMVHCGSRGYGWQTASYYMHAAAELRGIPDKQRERAHLFYSEPLGREYWAHACSAANYAIANRHIISEAVSDAFETVWGVRGEVYYEISHNLIQLEGVYFIHRKGATRAFGPTHPLLSGTCWEATGHPVLIPGSMYTGAAILRPTSVAWRSFFSVNHGSGRVLGRAQAKRAFGERQGEINDAMRTVLRNFNGVEIEGVLSNFRDIPLDESAKVYKDLDAVLDVLRSERIAAVERRMYPIANVKGID